MIMRGKMRNVGKEMNLLVKENVYEVKLANTPSLF